MTQAQRDNVFDMLGRLFEGWLEQNELGQIAGDAEEILLNDGVQGSGVTLTPAQRRWLHQYIALWEATEEGR